MIIECDSCSTKFRLDESRITGRGVKVRCTKCQSVFIVHAPDAEPPAQEPPTETPAETAPETSPETPPDTPATSPEEPAPSFDAADSTESEEGPSIGGLRFNLDSDEEDEESAGENSGVKSGESDFLLNGLNRAHQGNDMGLSIGENNVDLSNPEFNLPDEEEEPPAASPDAAAPGVTEDEESDDFTFEVEIDDDSETEPQEPAGVENRGVVEFGTDDELQSAFEDALKEAEEPTDAEPATAPETSPSEAEADDEMRQFLTTALETANEHMTTSQAVEADSEAGTTAGEPDMHHSDDAEAPSDAPSDDKHEAGDVRLTKGAQGPPLSSRSC
jgi:predicted Zn finger-like uncharacterized protein